MEKANSAQIYHKNLRQGVTRFGLKGVAPGQAAKKTWYTASRIYQFAV
jgi:hypothetical protein